VPAKRPQISDKRPDHPPTHLFPLWKSCSRHRGAPTSAERASSTAARRTRPYAGAIQTFKVYFLIVSSSSVWRISRKGAGVVAHYHSFAMTCCHSTGAGFGTTSMGTARCVRSPVAVPQNYDCMRHAARKDGNMTAKWIRVQRRPDLRSRAVDATAQVGPTRFQVNTDTVRQPDHERLSTLSSQHPVVRGWIRCPHPGRRSRPDRAIRQGCGW
jgi:hypothetical protein